MPTILPIVDLTAAVVGTKGVVSLATVAPSAEPGHFPSLQVYNESGCGLQLSLGQFVPAGGWRTFKLEPGDSELTWTVMYVLAGAPVTALILIYFAAHEVVSDIGILGNSPVGIGGTIGVTTISSLSQLTEAAGADVVVAQPTGAPGYYVQLTNEGKLVVKCLSGGIIRTALSLVPGVAGGAYSVVLGDAAAPTALLNGNALTASQAANADTVDTLHAAAFLGAAATAVDSDKVDGLHAAQIGQLCQAWRTEGTAVTSHTGGAGGTELVLIEFTVTVNVRSAVTISGAFQLAPVSPAPNCRLILTDESAHRAIDQHLGHTVVITTFSASTSYIVNAGSHSFKMLIWAEQGVVLTINKTIDYTVATFLSVVAVPTSS